jgi:hypothetical protein
MKEPMLEALNECGGPARPCSIHLFGGRAAADFPGMTLRDAFAERAMAALIEEYRDARDGDDRAAMPAPLAAEAYAIADAMLAARAIQPKAQTPAASTPGRGAPFGADAPDGKP